MADKQVVLVGLDSSPRSRDAMVAGQLLAEAYGDELHPVLVHRTGDAVAEPPIDSAVAIEEIAERSPADGLRRLVAAGGVRALVIGSSHRGALRRAVHHSVGEALLPDATCPIVVVPAGYADESRHLRSIGCGFDASPGSRLAWEAACDLGVRTNAALHLIGVHQRPIIGDMTAPMAGEVSRVNDDVRKAFDAQISRAVADAPYRLLVEMRSLDGEPVTVLRDASANLDLLVVGSRDFGSLGSLLLGTVASRLTTSAACPVMVVPGKSRCASDADENTHRLEEHRP